MPRSTRPLRTQLPPNPETQGERIRYARISSNLTQQQFADGISKLTRGKIDKGTVSKWEADSTANPGNATMLAIQAVTGFALGWLVNGKGDPKAKTAAGLGIQAPVLSRALTVVFPNVPPASIVAVATLYELILDAPDVSDQALRSVADALKAAR